MQYFRAIATACLVASVFGNATEAQVIPPSEQPGRVEQRFEAPPSARSAPVVRRGLEATMAPDEAEKILLMISDIRIEGNTVFSDHELRALFAPLIGRTVNLKQVFDLASQLTALYGERGYVLSRVIVPPQELEPEGAAIHLRALEGYIDEVRWPDGTRRYRNFFADYEARITAERPVRAQTMERYLLRANDLPGLGFSSTLVASETNPLASTLVVTMEEDHHDILLSIDNRGTEGTGPIQPTVIGTLSNALGEHEQFTLGYTTAGPDQGRIEPELHYFTFGYLQVLNPEGLTFSLSGNASWGDPGTPTLDAIEYQTEGLNVSAELLTPLIRTRSENLTGFFAFDYKDSDSRLIGGTLSNDRLRIFRAGLSYDRADEHAGVNQLNLSVSQGVDGLGSTGNDNPLASRANGKVDFFKVTGFAARTQELPHGFSAFVGVDGQWTDDPLLSSQECGYGGAFFGRAFEPSVITGDACVFALGELRHDIDLGQSPLGDHFKSAQVYGFGDYGHIWNLEAPLGTASQDDAASAGAGIRFFNDWLSADFQVAHTVEVPSSVAVDDGWHGFFEITLRH